MKGDLTMSEEQNVSSGQSNVTSGDVGNSEVEKMKAHQNKLLAELKAAKQKANELEAKEAERVQNELAEQGKFKEALESERKARLQSEETLKAKDRLFAKSVFEKEVKNLALQMGAHSNALDDIVLVGNKEFLSVEIDDNYNVNVEQLKQALGNLAKDKSYLFQSNVKKPFDVQTSGSSSVQKTKAVGEMSKSEIENALKALENK